MPFQRIPIGATDLIDVSTQTTLAFRLRWVFNPRVLIRPSLVEGGGAAYLDEFRITRINQGLTNIPSNETYLVRTYNDPVLSNAANVVDLTVTWEDYSASLVVATATLSRTLPGPNDPSFGAFRDTASPYSVRFSPSDPDLRTFMDDYDALADGEKDGTVLTLTDGRGLPIYYGGTETLGAYLGSTELPGGRAGFRRAVGVRPVRRPRTGTGWRRP